MSEIKKHQHIALLILKQISKQLSDSEMDILNNWINTNKVIYQKLKQKTFAKDIQTYQNINTDKAWQKYNRRYLNERKGKFITLYNISAAACVIVLVLSIALYTKYNTYNQKHKEETPCITPGSSKAILIVNNGMAIDLSSTKNNRIVIAENTTASNTGSQLSYCDTKKLGAQQDFEIFNEIVTPRGGEYKVVLSDSTAVWLNAETTLRYPVVFSGSTREVFLSGEAYFQVQKNDKQPFLIHTRNNLKIEVLGTSFNIKSYEDEHITETVLEKGAVNIIYENQSILLQPSYMATFEHKKNIISKKQVDTKLYTAWHNGNYIFYNEPLEKILKTLSRWYNIDIIFKNDTIKRLKFSGNVKKHESVKPLLEAIETSGNIQFEIIGNKVYVDGK